jgi:tyrosyl-tRNA synthetase
MALVKEKNMDFIEELKWRGLVKDCTDYDGLVERLKKPTVVYCGFDPTADSLHVGHLQQILLLRRYQLAGHTPIALCGGFTGMIGDPRPTTERKLLSHEEVLHNAACIKDQLAKFLSFEGENAAIMENNNNWLGKPVFTGFSERLRQTVQCGIYAAERYHQEETGYGSFLHGIHLYYSAGHRLPVPA